MSWVIQILIILVEVTIPIINYPKKYIFKETFQNKNHLALFYRARWFLFDV